MTQAYATIYLKDETFPIHAIVKNALANSLRGFTWFVENTEVNKMILINALGEDMNRTQPGYYLEHAKGFIPNEQGDHIALSVSVTDLSLEQLQTLAQKPTVFKIHEHMVVGTAETGSLTHPQLIKNGSGIDRCYIINKLATTEK